MIRRSVFTLILSLGIAVTAAAETSERTNDLALGEVSTRSAEEIQKRLITKSYTFTEAQFRAPAVPNNVVELALNEVGSGSAAEMRKRIFNIPIMVLGAIFRREAIKRLPASISQQRITSGKLLRRAEKIIQPVLQLDNRDERVELFLYQSKTPRAALWMGCVLILSDSLVALLYGSDLMGIVAHELAHSYFMDEMVAAQKTNDERGMKVIELKCDAVAMLLLKLLGSDPIYHIRGVKMIVNRNPNNSFSGVPYLQSSGELRTHPSVVERAVFAQRFVKLLT